MKVAFTIPAEGEAYLSSKKDAARLAKLLYPGLQLLAFQTMHTPRMSSSIPYLATFTDRYVRMLSVQSSLASEELRGRFLTSVLPYIYKRAHYFSEISHFWPAVIVSIGGSIHEVNCMEGGLFPNAEEIGAMIHRNPSFVC